MPRGRTTRGGPGANYYKKPDETPTNQAAGGESGTTETSPQAMQAEIERLRAENATLKVAAAPVSPGKNAREQWVEDKEVPPELRHGGFHDISNPVPGVDSGRARLPHTYDALTVSDDLAKRMGLNLENEEPVWVRKDNWMGLNINQAEEFIDHNQGGRVCYSKDGLPHHRGDLVLCARLKQYGSELVGERLSEAAKRDAEIYPHRDGDLTEAEKKASRDSNMDALGQLFNGSITRGMPLEKAGTLYTAEQTRAQRDRYLFQGRTPPVTTLVDKNSVENTRDLIGEAIKEARTGRGGTHPVSITINPDGTITR